ncbi:ABC-type phosphate transport system, periplasmic component [Thioflavicoccus mobilis 8321]|uniref:ABC-type phosphate transport system, periplasmic component n=1 Tax=Thioflavicoccus mobilis 8321 TaxID=765912 RepID=L0GWW5_9GAMM|nr:PstS family phosphate ABC transporter substrate-binding protein [Thioflavicoccus mobilis]AGA91253.1 ABC-type phosphate transport system, periplasmic component [Thioflavicoccus mobilis 8321]
MRKTLIAAAVTAVAATASVQAMARDTINIVGSSTVFPFATTVAETFGRTTDFNTPKIESTGSGGGFKLFCAGVGVDTPDITNASRRMKPSEYETCVANGVKDIVEIVIGYDGITIANSKEAEQVDLGLKQVYMALAKDVPDPSASDFKLVANPYKTWNDVQASLPETKIEVLGPPPTSGTRDAFAELAMEGGCKTFDDIKALKDSDKDKFKAVCMGIREDGHYIEAGENDNLIVQKLVANPDAMGIFGFSFLDQNSDKIQGAKIEGVAPTFDTIADGSYPLSRSLYFYVKKAHVGTIPGIEEYVAEFTSEKAWGMDGYLADKGLISLPDDERKDMAKTAKAMKTMGKPE